MLTSTQAVAVRSALPNLPPSCVLRIVRCLNPIPRRERLRRRKRAFSALRRNNHKALRLGNLHFHQRPTYASGRRRDKMMRLCDVIGCRDYAPWNRYVTALHSDPFGREFVVCGNCSDELRRVADSELLGRTIGPACIAGLGAPTDRLSCIPADLRGRQVSEFRDFHPTFMASDDPNRFYVKGEYPLRPYDGNVWG